MARAKATSPPVVPARPVTIDGRTAALIALTVLMLAAALLPCVVSVSPQVYFDVDPRSDAGKAPITTLGPAPQAWYHVGVVLLSAGGVALHLALGGRIRWVSTALVLIGVGFCAWHMPARFDGMIRGGAWIAAATLALTALHLSEHAVVRRLTAAAVVALLVPMAIDALGYVYIEHPNTVAMFRAQEAEFLAARGWSENSPQHLLYKRRLEFPDATGAFGLSNVFGSFLAAFAVAGCTVAWRAWRQRHHTIVAAAVVAIVCGLVSLYLTHSKGATAAFLLGAVAVTLASSRWRRWSPYAAIALVLVPILAVFIRGSLGLPSDHTGERSLLFRYQYWHAVPTIVRNHPITGVGPGGFKQAYLLAKDPFNPEDVTAVHNVFIDWLAMLGIGGAAWTIVAVTWLWFAGRSVIAADGEPLGASQPQPLNLRSRETLAMLALAAILFGVQYSLELPQMLPETAIGWIIGVVAFVGIAAMLASPTLDRRWPRIGLFVATCVLLVQAQIEMTFYQESSAMPAWLLVAVAAGAASPQGRRARVVWALPILLLCGAIVMAIFYAAPVQRQQDKLAAAASSLRLGQMTVAIERLADAAAILPNDTQPVQWQAQLLLEAAAWHAHNGDRTAAGKFIDAAIGLVDHRPDDTALLRIAAQSLQYKADLLQMPALLADALTRLRQVVKLNPYSIQDRLALADLLWQTGHRTAAVSEYQRCLKLSDQAYLDPARQLTDAQRQHIRERMGD